MSDEFVEPKGRSNNYLCCLMEGIMCRGKSCVLWDDPEDNQLYHVADNCLFRLALKQIVNRL